MKKEVVISLKNVSLRFRLSYEKVWTYEHKLRELFRKWSGKSSIKYFEPLKGINLDIYRGDKVGIIGANGAGKSTLLKLIAGIYKPDGGTLHVKGSVSSLLSIGTGFSPELSGMDNIRLSAYMRKIKKNDIEKRLPDIVDFCELEDFLNVPIKYYSTGMISRLGFAISAAMKPDILLIDEIFSVGDLKFQKKSEKAMQSLLDNSYCQVIVSHDLQTVERVCNRAILVHQGSIISDGPPNKVIKDYYKLQGHTE